MKKKTLKILLSTLLVLLITSAATFASTELLTASTTPDTSKVKVVNMTRKLLELLQLIGVAIALVMLIVIGIRSIISAGEKTAPDIKAVAIHYVFGAICIFGATGILTTIQQLVAQFTNGL